jgi:multidrug efflux pump
MLIGTFLTLYVVPAMYTYLTRRTVAVVQEASQPVLETTTA